MTWDSRCGQFRVQESKNLFDGVTRYYAMILKDGKFQLLEHMKSHRTRKAAEDALVTHLKAPEPPKPKRRRRKKDETSDRD